MMFQVANFQDENCIYPFLKSVMKISLCRSFGREFHSDAAADTNENSPHHVHLCFVESPE